MSDLVGNLKTKRHSVWERSKALAETAAYENRKFTVDEQLVWQSLDAEIDALDKRIEQLRGEEKRDRDSSDAMAELQGRAGGGRPRFRDADDVASAFRSALVSKNPAPIDVVSDRPRSYYQPGLEQRDLLKTTATQAMPVSVYDRIVAVMVENSAVMAAGATVITTSSGEDLQIPKGTAFVTSALTSEGGSITESDATMAVSTLKAYKFASFFQVSQELANDTPVDLLSYLARQAGESLALAFGPYLITGTGSSQPQGVVTAATTGKTGPTGTATTLGTQSTAGQGTDCLYDLVGSLAEPYSRQPSTGFVMANSSLAICRKLKDSAGQPVAGMVGGGLNAAVSGAPSGNNVVLGYPTFVDPSVAAMSANSKSIVFGDFSRYFVRIAGGGIRFERSDDYAFQSDLVSFRCIIRLDGALVDSSAVKLFVNSAT